MSAGLNLLRGAARSLACTALLALLALAGCSTIWPRVDVADTTPAAPVQAPEVKVANGSIFQSANYRPLFEDHRARLVGDTLTVAIVEKVSATQKSTSSIDKSGTVSASVSALPGIKAAAFARAGADGTSANTFAGKGATENSNDFRWDPLESTCRHASLSIL